MLDNAVEDDVNRSGDDTSFVPSFVGIGAALDGVPGRKQWVGQTMLP